MNDDILSRIREAEELEPPAEEAGVVAREREYEEPTPTLQRNRAKKSKRVTLHISDGKLDIGRTPPPQLQLVRDAIGDTPGAAQALGVQTTENLEIPESLCAMTVGLLNSLEKMIAIMALKVPPSIANQALTITPQQVDLLVPPLKKVAEKYIPAEAMQYSPELELGLAVLQVGQQHYAACMLLMRNKYDKPDGGLQPDITDGSVTV